MSSLTGSHTKLSFCGCVTIWLLDCFGVALARALITDLASGLDLIHLDNVIAVTGVE